jgi:hypothetical protein
LGAKAAQAYGETKGPAKRNTVATTDDLPTDKTE